MPEPVPPVPNPTPEPIVQHPPEEEEVDGHVLVNDLLDQHKTMEEIYQILEDGGLSLGEATGLISEVVRERRRLLLKPHRKELRRIGGNNMLIGGLFFLVGSVATIGSYAAAAGQGGGTYMVAAGAIIFGAIQFSRGLGQVNEANR